METQRFKALDDESRLDVIAVDLGYSARRKSCGLALGTDDTSMNCMFGHCIRRTAEAIRSADGAVVLAVEAVLCTRHDNVTGNPIARMPAERGREWYRQPGVVTFAAALRFLDRLHHLVPSGMTVNLAEAFLSNKAARTGHADDAARIARGFWRVPPVELPAGLEVASPHVAGVPPIRVFD
jgi:hypothetical protein